MNQTHEFCKSGFSIFTTILLSLVFIITVPASATLLPPGITQHQHEYAQKATNEVYSLHWAQAESLCLAMQAMEKADSLLPMSYLLRFSTRVWRLLNNEFETASEGAAIRKELDPLRTECMRILHTHHFADSTRPTRMFLEAGINGFNATLLIRTRPLFALSPGLQAYRMLDSVRTLAPQIKDVYLGLGLFQCALANNPGIIHFAIRLFSGLRVSQDSGLAFLAICADSGSYSREGAMEYEIQFLSPFKPAEAAQKEKVFATLRSMHPQTSLYVFQALDEKVTFHRSTIFNAHACAELRHQIPTMDTSTFSGRRYAELVRWQCFAVDTGCKNAITPEPFPPKSAYSFYPLFLQAALQGYKNETAHWFNQHASKVGAHNFHLKRDVALAQLKRSEIDPMLQEYYLWHFEDGLR